MAGGDTRSALEKPLPILKKINNDGAPHLPSSSSSSPSLIIIIVIFYACFFLFFFFIWHVKATQATLVLALFARFRARRQWLFCMAKKKNVWTRQQSVGATICIYMPAWPFFLSM
jgi:hypothetical protein